MHNSDNFEFSDISLDEIFIKNKKYTFLAGAGISMPSPTSLPLGNEIKNIFINHMIPLEERDRIFSLTSLRLEQIIYFVEKYLDSDLSFIDYFDERGPNLLHYFLAHAIMNGHNVMTTNFDCMIEKALLQSDVNIVPVITKEDFLNHSNPESEFHSGRYPVYKIHGSKINYITKESTKDSLIATISAIAKEGEANTFSIASYKMQAFQNLMRDRILVVMGYSGGDEFDISPTLCELSEFSTIIWINHKSDMTLYNAEIKILNENFISDGKEISNHDGSKKLFGEILNKAKKRDKLIQIYNIDISTSMLVEQYLFDHLFPSEKTLAMQKIKSQQDKFDLQSYIVKLSPISDVMKYEISCWIYFDIIDMKSTYRCAEEGLNLAQKEENLEYQIGFLKWLGILSRFDRQFLISNEYYARAIEISREMNIPSETADILNEIGRNYEHRMIYDTARDYYEQALAEISDKDMKKKTVFLNNIGNTYLINGQFNLALPLFEKVLQIVRQINDLDGIAFSLFNISIIKFHLGETIIAIHKCSEAIQYASKIGDFYLKARFLERLSEMYFRLNEFELSLTTSTEALKIYELLYHREGVANVLFNIGLVYYSQGLYSNAIEKFEESARIFSKSGFKDKEREVRHWINESYFKLGKLNIIPKKILSICLGSLILSIPFGALISLLVTIIVNIVRFELIILDNYLKYFTGITILLIFLNIAKVFRNLKGQK